MWVRRSPGQTAAQVFGLAPPAQTAAKSNGTANGTTKHTNGSANGSAKSKSASSAGTEKPYSALPLLARFAQCALFVSIAAPFGFAALQHISYPTMVLGKSCKLVPVMLMNVLLYRRSFAPHKYLVVALVTIGITAFMGLGNSSSSKHSKSSSGEAKSELWGIFLLLINLLIDGATNSTQDEIFARYKHINGQQMMFWLNLFASLLTSSLISLPLPPIPIIHPSPAKVSGAGGVTATELVSAIRWIREHPDVLKPLANFAITGAMGQLFIFETLQHFGSLTLTYVLLFRNPH
ncbi:hypothetical protein DL93DRAFT_2075331 [Clavulina sp. PMI_390]|nr:hypothetical protein DL93DRAFT_2075331 [Clavulina sp. PMI_390]